MDCFRCELLNEQIDKMDTDEMIRTHWNVNVNEPMVQDRKTNKNRIQSICYDLKHETRRFIEENDDE